jgi:hypothetical protein
LTLWIKGAILTTLRKETEMQDKDMIEYAQWIVADTVKHLIPAVGIYAVALGAYWIFVG